MIISSMKGLGDNIYQRAFVRELPGPVWLDTPWPELYQDLLGVNFVKPITKLRTQAKNVQRTPVKWVPQPRGPVTQISYGNVGILPGMHRQFKVRPRVFDLPSFGSSTMDAKYVVVRPATIRAEWHAESRNPLPEYIVQAAAVMRAKGYTVVSVADLEPGKEWAVEPLPEYDTAYHAGELEVREMMALIQGASAVIGGVGWLLPAAVAYKVPAWIICGGWGMFNSPEKLTAPPMDLSNLTFAVPDNFCLCSANNHKCDKRIFDYAAKLAEWTDKFPAVV